MWIGSYSGALSLISGVRDSYGNSSWSSELCYVRQTKLMYSYAIQKEMESQNLDCHLQSRRDMKYTDYLPYITSQFMGQLSTTESHQPGNISLFHHSYWGNALMISLLRDQRNDSPNCHFTVNEWQARGSKLWMSDWLSGIQTSVCLPTQITSRSCALT